VLLELTWVIC